MEDRLTLSIREQKWLRVMNNDIEKRKMKVGEAAEILEISKRQGWRVLAAYRKGGVARIAHGNRGRTPVHVLGEEIRGHVWMWKDIMENWKAGLREWSGGQERSVLFLGRSKGGDLGSELLNF